MFAIVVTLSLVAIQQSASTYSPRIIDAFIRKPDIWVLSFAFIGTIIYGLTILKEINTLPIDLIKIHIFRIYIAGIFALILLLFFIKNTLNLLKPSSAISWIRNFINPKNVEVFTLNQNFISQDDDPIQQLLDIINISLMKHESETARIGIFNFWYKINNFMSSDYFEDENLNEMKSNFISVLVEIGITGINNKCDSSVELISQCICASGKNAINERNDEIMKNVIDGLKNLTIEAINQRNRKLISSCSIIFTKLGLEASKYNSKEVRIHINSSLDEILNEVIIQRMEKEFDLILTDYKHVLEESVEDMSSEEVKYVVYNMDNKATSSFRHEMPNITVRTVNVLTDFTSTIISKKPKVDVGNILYSFEIIGKEAVENKATMVAVAVLRGINKISSELIKNRDEKSIYKAESLVMDIYLDAIKKDLHEIETYAIDTAKQIRLKIIKSRIKVPIDIAKYDFERIVIELFNRNLISSIGFLIDNLKLIGIAACDEYSRKDVEYITTSLKIIGKKTIEYGIQDSSKRSIQYLQIIGIKASEENFRKETSDVIDSIKILGEEGLNKHSVEVVEYSIKSLTALAQEIEIKHFKKEATDIKYFVKKMSEDAISQGVEISVKNV